MVIGERVYWLDPAGTGSGWGKISSLQHDPPEEDSVIGLDLESGGFAEVLRHELHRKPPELFRVTFNLNRVGEYPTLKAAFKKLYDEIRAALDAHTFTYQQLETMCWIQEGQNVPVYFYDLRDHACQQGWLKGGTWVEEEPELFSE